MHAFVGHDARLYAAGEPFAFTRMPLVDCGDGFTWRGADESLRCWVEGSEFAFEAYDGGAWSPACPVEVCAPAATVAFNRCLSGLAVRASGVALTTSLVATGADWELEQDVLQGVSLSGPALAKGDTVARVTGVPPDEWSWVAQVRRVLAVLPSGAVGAFVGLGGLARDVAGLKVTFDDRGVTYAS